MSIEAMDANEELRKHVADLLDEDYSGACQHLRSWSEIDGLFRKSAEMLMALSERSKRMENALLNAKGLIDNPVGRRKIGQSQFYDEVLETINDALALDPAAKMEEASKDGIAPGI